MDETLTLLLEDEDSAPEQDIIEEKILNEDIKPALALDYKIKTTEGRAQLVQRIIEETPAAQLTARYLEILGDYIMGAITKEEKKARTYLTENRLITINRRETSFEGLVEKFENGEDGIYNIMATERNILLSPRVEITAADIEVVPGLKALRAAIDDVEAQSKAAIGKRKFLLKKQLIEMRRDQYVLKNSYYNYIQPVASQRGSNKINLEEHRWIDEKGGVHSDALITFLDPKHVSALLCHYEALKGELRAAHQNDFYYLIQDFERLMHRALQDYPMYHELVKLKMDGKSNLEIQEVINEKFNIKHSVEYISSLWRNKIPKIIAEQEKRDYLVWYYETELPGKENWKKCSHCKTWKPRHEAFFTHNTTSKDGFYSWCKDCRKASR